MNQDDWSAFLKAKIDDRKPKCGNCKHWVVAMSHPTFGVCGKYPAGGTVTFEEGEHYGVALGAVTDLSLCSAWEKAPTKPDPE